LNWHAECLGQDNFIQKLLSRHTHTTHLLLCLDHRLVSNYLDMLSVTLCNTVLLMWWLHLLWML